MTDKMEKTNGRSDWLQTLENKLREKETAHLPAARLMNLFLQEFDTNANLKNCTARSLSLALENCIIFGLQPGPMHHVALVPRGNQCIWTLQYQGISELLMRSGVVLEMHAQAYTKDDLDSGRLQMSTFPRSISHTGRPPEVNKDNIHGAYFAVQFTDGRSYFENCYLDEIMRRRNAATTKKVWDAHFIPMAEKSPIRKAFTKNRIPLDPQVAGVIAEAFERDPSWKADAIEATAAPVNTRATRAAEVYAGGGAPRELPEPAPTPAPEASTRHATYEPTGDEDTKPPIERRSPTPPPAARKPPPRRQPPQPQAEEGASLAQSFEQPASSGQTPAPITPAPASTPAPAGPPKRPGPPGAGPKQQAEAAAQRKARQEREQRERAAKDEQERQRVLDEQAQRNREAEAQRGESAAQEPPQGEEQADEAPMPTADITAALEAAGLDYGAAWDACGRLGLTEDYDAWCPSDVKAIIANAIGADNNPELKEE
jgi:recombinational DNA repair protein RecT